MGENESQRWAERVIAVERERDEARAEVDRLWQNAATLLGEVRAAENDAAHWKAEAERLREALLSPFEARAVLVALSFGVPDPMPQEIRDARSKIAGMERAALSAGGGTDA